MTMDSEHAEIIHETDVLVLGSDAAGCGAAIRLEERFMRLSDSLTGRLRSDTPLFTEGLVNAAVLFHIGAISFLGSFDVSPPPPAEKRNSVAAATLSFGVGRETEVAGVKQASTTADQAPPRQSTGANLFYPALTSLAVPDPMNNFKIALHPPEQALLIGRRQNMPPKHSPVEGNGLVIGRKTSASQNSHAASGPVPPPVHKAEAGPCPPVTLMPNTA